MKRLLILAGLAALSACETIGGVGGSAVGNGITWRCDGGSSFTARFATSGAQVRAGGRTYNLPHARSASGARYANGSVEYWERAGRAQLSGAVGGPYLNCRRG